MEGRGGGEGLLRHGLGVKNFTTLRVGLYWCASKSERDITSRWFIDKAVTKIKETHSLLLSIKEHCGPNRVQGVTGHTFRQIRMTPM